MTRKEIQVGHTYMAKVSGQLVPVKIKSELQIRGGWCGENLRTRRLIHIKTAGRLRYEVTA